MLRTPHQILQEISIQLGSNLLRIQGAGGNLSWKGSGNMIIKASGTWLSHADREEIFVVIGPEGPMGPLRPSIETIVHAILPFSYVFHTHSLIVLRWAVLHDIVDTLQRMLHGLPWQWIPYARPGAPLATMIQERIAPILILQNHGLIVSSNDPWEALALMDEVEARLRVPPIPITWVPSTPPPGYRWPRFEAIQFLQHIPCWKILYPDQAIFFDASSWTHVSGHGIAVREQISDAAELALLTHAALWQRLPPHPKLSFLSQEEVNALTNWEAETYRQKQRPCSEPIRSVSSQVQNKWPVLKSR